MTFRDLLNRVARIVGARPADITDAQGGVALTDAHRQSLRASLDPDAYSRVISLLEAGPSATAQGAESSTASASAQGAEGSTTSASAQGVEGSTASASAQGAESSTASASAQGAEGSTTSASAQGVEGSTATAAQSGTGDQSLAQALDRAGSHAELTRQLSEFNRMLSTVAAANPQVRSAASAGEHLPLVDAQGLFPDLRGDFRARSLVDINAFSDARPWNAHAREAIAAATRGHSYTATGTFASSFVLRQLEADIAQELFLLPAEQVSDLSGDARRLPAFWRNAYNIQSGQTYGLSEAGHVIQPFGDGFKPNNQVVFQPEVVSLQKVEINYEFDVDRLAEIENSWLMMFNQPAGSANAFKMPFVRYMLLVLSGVKESDLREALVSGVWAPNATRKPGYYLNSITGLFYKISQARGRKYRPFTTLGTPNTSNIVDYIESFCQQVEDAVGKKANMKIYLKPLLATAYRRLQADRLQVYVDDVPMRVEGHPNFELIPFDYLTGSFIFCTDANNIVIVNGPATEENQLRVVTSIKGLQMAGQFYKGIHVGVFGMEFSEGDPVNLRSQRFFSNAEDIEYASVPADADATTLSAKYGDRIRIGANTSEATITAIKDYQSGRPITIEGPLPVVSDSGAVTAAPYGAKIVPGTTFIDPASASEYILGTGTSLRLMPLGNDKFAIVGYDAGPVADSTVVLAADAVEIPAPKDKQVFLTSDNSKATVIATIAESEDLYNGFSIRIQGGGTSNASTMATTDTIILREGMTFSKGSELTLSYQAGKWYEIARK